MEQRNPTETQCQMGFSWIFPGFSIRSRENIRAIRKQGLKKWKQQSGYHRRSLAETAMFRLKTIFGNQLTSRKFDNQLVEAIIKCRALNFMTELGMPDSYVL